MIASARNKKRLLVLISIVVVAVSFGIGLFVAYSNQCDLKLGETCISLEVADTQDTRAQGLSGRDGLATNTGMLFVFDNDGSNCMWMSDMEFPIDMVWLNAQKEIVMIADNVSPDTFPQTFCSEEMLSRYVLEVPAGTVQQYGLQLGQKLNFR